MNNRLTCIFALCSVYATAIQPLNYNPGVVASLNTIVIENHKMLLSNFIIEKLNGVHIPDIPFTHGDVSGGVSNNTY